MSSYTFDEFRSDSVHDLGNKIAKMLGPEVSVRGYDTECHGVYMGESYGLFTPEDRIVHILPERARLLEPVCNGGLAMPDTVDALRTLVHELWHAASPMFKPGGDALVRRPEGLFFEEGIAELRARLFLADRIFGVPSDLAMPNEFQVAFGTRHVETRAARWLLTRIGAAAVDEIWSAPSGRARAEVAARHVAAWCSERLQRSDALDERAEKMLRALPVRIVSILRDPVGTDPGAGTLRLDTLNSDPPNTNEFRRTVLNLHN